MVTRLIFAASIAASFASSATAETYVERSLSTTPWGFVRISSPVRAGERAQMFEARPGDCGNDGHHDDCTTDRERTEVWLPRDQWSLGDVRWIGYSVMVPPDFEPSDPVVTMAGQVKMNNGATDVHGGTPALFMLNIDRHGYTACISREEGPREAVNAPCEHIHLLSLEEMRGRWTDIQIGVDLATPGSRVEIWVNGRQVGRSSGGHLHPGDRYYFKYGIYRSFVSRYGGPLPTQRLFYDEVKIGMTREEVAVDLARPVD